MYVGLGSYISEHGGGEQTSNGGITPGKNSVAMGSASGGGRLSGATKVSAVVASGPANEIDEIDAMLKAEASLASLSLPPAAPVPPEWSHESKGIGLMKYEGQGRESDSYKDDSIRRVLGLPTPNPPTRHWGTVPVSGPTADSAKADARLAGRGGAHADQPLTAVLTRSFREKRRTGAESASRSPARGGTEYSPAPARGGGGHSPAPARISDGRSPGPSKGKPGAKRGSVTVASSIMNLTVAQSQQVGPPVPHQSARSGRIAAGQQRGRRREGWRHGGRSAAGSTVSGSGSVGNSLGSATAREVIKEVARCNGPTLLNANQRQYSGSHCTPTLAFVQERRSSGEEAVSRVGLAGTRIRVPKATSAPALDSVSVASRASAASAFEVAPPPRPVPPSPTGLAAGDRTPAAE